MVKPSLSHGLYKLVGVVLVFASLARAQQSNPVPVLTSLSTATVLPLGIGYEMKVTGSNFVNGSNSKSVVRWNGIDKPTSFDSATQLTATLKSDDILGARTQPAQVTVFNPAPGGGLSNALTYPPPANNPTPTISFLSPDTAVAGSASFTLTVIGSNLITGAVVQWNGSSRTTTFVSATQLTASIPASDIATGGTAQVTVFNPSPGGGTSNALPFSITISNNPAPTLASLSITSAVAGGAGFTLSVTGSGFVSGSVVQWNGSSRTTTFVSATQLTASIPASDIAIAGTAVVAVVNPVPGGGISATLPFTISSAGPPPPTINPGGLLNAANGNNRPPSAGMIASLFGTNFASSIFAATSYPLPTVLGGVSINIKPVTPGAIGITPKDILPVGGILAPLFSVSPNQINFQVPPEVQGLAQATATVIVNGIIGNSITFNIADYNPGIFTANQQGTGQGLILIATSGELAAPSGSVPGIPARPVKRGEYISIYCIGLGPVTNQPPGGFPASSNPVSVTKTNANITIGGVPAPATEFSFSGLAPGFVGLYQVNVQIPPGAPTSDAVPVVFSIGGLTTNTVTVAVQ